MFAVIMAKNYPKSLINTNRQEAQKTPVRINHKTHPTTRTHTHILYPACRKSKAKGSLKRIQNKEKINNKNLFYLRPKIRITVDFSSESMQVNKEWVKIFKVLEFKNKNLKFYAWAWGTAQWRGTSYQAQGPGSILSIKAKFKNNMSSKIISQK